MPIYQPKNPEELKARCLQDMRLAASDAGVAELSIKPGSDADIIASGFANLAILGFMNVAASDAQRSVLDATGSQLDEFRKAERLPEVGASPSSGRLVIRVLGPTTVPVDLQFKLPNGLRGKVTIGVVNPADRSEVNVVAIDKGVATNLAAGEEVTFISPPSNLVATATVSTEVPLSGGTDAENDERKRDRILNAKQGRLNGSNRAFARQTALDALGSVQDAYVYSALDGVGSMKVAVVRKFDRENNSYSRELSDAAVTIVRSAIHSKVPAGDDVTVQSALDEVVDFGIQVEIPEASAAGGNGNGWTDEVPWPNLVTADGGRVTIDAVSSDFLTVTVSAETTTSPVAGQTHVAWWSGVDRRFYFALVVSVAGASGAWVLGLDKPFVDSIGNGPVLGDFLSPQAQHLEKYGETWISLFEELGPGENVAAPVRARRWPFATDEDPYSVTRSTLLRLVNANVEITDYEFSYAPVKTPSVPGTTALAPNVLVPRRFGVYPL